MSTAGLAAMECVVVQDLFLNETAQLRPCFPAGLDLPRKGRHLHQCRAPHPARAQGDEPEERLRRLGDHPAARQRHGLCRCITRTRREIMDEIARHDAELRRRVLREARRAGLGAMALQRRRRPRARRSCTSAASRAARASSSSPNMSPTDERTGPRFPLLLTTGRILSQYNVGAQTRRTDNVAVARGGSAGNPSARRRAARHSRRRLGEARTAARARPPCAR